LINAAAAFVAAATALAPALAYADMTSCVALAREIATGETVHYSESELSALKYYSTCQATSDADSFGLDVDVIDIVTVGVDLSEDERRQFCSTSQDALQISDMDYTKARRLFSEALGTIDKCIDASERGWQVEYSQIHQDAVSLDISNTFTEGARLNGIEIIPPGAMTCTGAPTEFPKLVTATDYVSMTCIRTPTTANFDGVTVTSAPDVVVNLRLAGGPFPIELPGYQSSVLDKIRLEIRQVGIRADEQLQSLKSALTTRSGDRTSVHVKDTDAFPGQLPLPVYGKNCPPGQYVAGLEMYGGRHEACVGCMLAVNLICAPLATE
jgi:hypothetical protein